MFQQNVQYNVILDLYTESKYLKQAHYKVEFEVGRRCIANVVKNVLSNINFKVCTICTCGIYILT